jgi:EmrB/QacA subfamily drug resistance transporter
VTALTHAAAAPRERPLSTAGLLVLTVGALDSGLEGSIVLPALPAIARHYDASLVAVSWLATGFLLAAVVAVPLLGRLGDLFGKRRLLLVALGAFGLGSLICALAGSIELVIAGRIVQGIGIAAGPLTYALVRDTVEPERVPRAIGAVVGMASVGATVGFVVSGLLVDHVSVMAIFWFLFALAVVLIVSVAALVPETSVRGHSSVDIGGAASLGLGLACLLLAISKGRDWDWFSARIVGLFLAAAGFLTLFVLIERRIRDPLVDLQHVVKRPFVNAHVCAFTLGLAFFISAFLVPLIAATPEESGYGLGLTITQTGLISSPVALGSLAAGWLGGRFVDVVGPRVLIATGSVLGVAGYVSLALAHSSILSLCVGNAAVGLGIGFLLTSIAAVVVRTADQGKTSIAVAMTTVTRTIANAVGVALTATIVAEAGVEAGFIDEDGFVWGFCLGAVGCGFALFAAVFMPGRPAAAR